MNNKTASFNNLKRTSNLSSRNLHNHFYNIYSEEQKKYINNINKKFSFKNIKNLISKLLSIRVLVVGEAIIDQYVFCEALGKSGKEPILVLRKINTDQYYGGALALSNNVSSFCKSVKLFTMIGEKKEYKKDIIKNNKKNISVNFFYKNNSPTIVKKRFVDSINKNKILGVYEINDDLMDAKQQNNIQTQLSKLKGKVDHVLVADYGHGFISEKTAKYLTSMCKSISLSAQLNATSNFRINTIDKYKKIQTLVINEMELRQEMYDRTSQIKTLMKKLTKRIQLQYLIVTRGANGSILYDKRNNQFSVCPEFASNVVDKVGAGDAMLSVVSIALSSGIDKHLSLLLGSLASSQSIETMGPGMSVDKNKILNTIENLLE